MAVQKKAKLAHEKKAGGAEEGFKGQFNFRSVVELVEFSSGEKAAIVDLDGNGTLGIVDRHYVSTDPKTGEHRPSPMACPAVYDETARQLAIERHKSYTAG
ncbi:MAG: hypothetical protein ACQEXJ_19260 [Myxococcota bacterium]